MLDLRIIEYGSCEYQEMVELRTEVLRKPLGLSFSTDQLQKEINDVLIGGFLTIDGKQQLVACCILTPVDNDNVQLRQMAVSSLIQGKGLGSEIVTFAEQYAVNNGFKVLLMHARKVAAGFYLKLGYAIHGDEFIEVGIPHYEMRKNLK
ncbi:GNAT family N-acetyltransferase [Chitinophaga silvatica]|uniref:GNAT family N-acetyltransferase n=1 Tax=Chitinophaga silvatica TaxID=2282649 RepID=A0A3E1YA88_9BACT|nr:GNAT family N-acetyltransferase [Chitinophaga silvatica]RFS22546.1 GNAT family N-acetyltransferase [Chitinophaga silvatica]